MNNESATKCLISGVITLPDNPQSLREVVQCFPFPHSKPKEAGSSKERSFWVSQELIKLWWPNRNIFRSEEEGFEVLQKYGTRVYFSEEMHSYLTARFNKYGNVQAVRKIIARYLASLVYFFEQGQGNEIFERFRKEAEIARNSAKKDGEETDPLILPINFILAVPDVIQLFVSALVCLEQKLGRYASKKEAEDIQSALIPIVLMLSMHHNSSAGESLRYLLGEGGLSMYDAFAIEIKEGKYKIVVSKTALAHISQNLKRSGLQAAEVLQTPDQLERMGNLCSRVERIIDREESEGQKFLSNEEHRTYGKMYRTLTTAVAAKNGTESIGCPMSLVKDKSEGNAMVSFSVEVMSSFIEYVYEKT